MVYFWILVIILSPLIAPFFPKVEIFITSAIAGSLLGYKTNNLEYAFWGFIGSLIALFAIYFSRLGIILSIIFSIIWAGITWAVLYQEIKMSLIGSIIIGLAVFLFNFAIRESIRNKREGQQSGLESSENQSNFLNGGKKSILYCDAGNL